MNKTEYMNLLLKKGSFPQQSFQRWLIVQANLVHVHMMFIVKGV